MICLLLSVFSVFFFSTAEAETIDALIAGARQGSVEDQYKLGKAYLHGKGVRRDYENAIKWLGKAAAEGHVRAQTKMGWMYENGKGVKKDYGMAFSWYEKAAGRGYGYAQRPLGKFYELGLGVDPSPEKAVYWYEKAARQGIARAQANLGIMYETGAGVARDYQKAVFWYKKTTEKAYPRGQYLLGKMYELGLGVKKDINVAKAWYRKSAASKYSRAIKRLGDLAAKEPDKPAIQQDKNLSLPVRPKKEKEPAADKQTVEQFSDEVPVVAEITPDLDTIDRDLAKSTAQEYFFKGNSFAAKGQLVQAVSEYKRALIYDPGNANTLENMGITYAELGKFDEGVKLMHDAISANPADAGKYASLGIMLHAMHRDREALIQYQNAIKNNPALPKIYFNMAIIFTKLRDYDRAWKSLNLAGFFGYRDKELRRRLISVSKEPEMSWPVDNSGYYLRQLVVSTKEKARTLRQRLIDGADFSALVKSEGLAKHSANGGYMGYLKASKIAPDIAESLKNLPLFSYSEVIETDQGFHIFQRLVLPQELFATDD